MSRSTMPILALCSGVALVLAGCGGSDGGNSSNSNGNDDPPDEAVTQSATATQAMEKSGEAVINALVEQNSNVVWVRKPADHDSALATTWPFRLGGSLQAVSTEGFEFSSDWSAIVDLDSPVPGGSEDRYPNATGSLLIEVTATGDTDSCLTTGEVAHTVAITVQDDVVVTDPHDGGTVTWPSGGRADWTVDVVWSWADDENWSYTADVTKRVEDRKVEVTTAAGDTFKGVVDVDAEARRTAAMTAGVFSTTFKLSGIRHVEWTAPSGKAYDVTWDVRNLGRIFLTVNDEEYGPYTLAEIIRFFRVGLNTEAG